MAEPLRLPYPCSNVRGDGFPHAYTGHASARVHDELATFE